MPGPVDRVPLDDFVCLPLYAASRAMVRAYAPLLEPWGLTYPQYLVVTVLGEEAGELPVHAVGGRLRLDSGTLTPLLKRLEGAGLVVRRRDPGDERRVLVALTDEGRTCFEQLAAVPSRLVEGTAMSVEEVVSLRRQLDLLLDNLEGAEDARS